MFTKQFAKDLAERAVKTFAQALAAAVIAGETTGLLDADWSGYLSVAGLATVLSVLTSVGSGAVTGTDSASVVDTAGKRELPYSGQ